jgi:hypothetical protein
VVFVVIAERNTMMDIHPALVVGRLMSFLSLVLSAVHVKNTVCYSVLVFVISAELDFQGAGPGISVQHALDHTPNPRNPGPAQPPLVLPSTQANEEVCNTLCIDFDPFDEIVTM